MASILLVETNFFSVLYNDIPIKPPSELCIKS